MAEIVYLLCAVTSLLCATLLARNYFKNRTGILLWSGICFVCLSLNNLLLLVDLTVFPEVNLFSYRNLVVLSGLVLFLFGLIWETI